MARKQFTPRMLQRFDEEGRGLGTYGKYLAWHQVTRSEPASHGRSHILRWPRTSRDHHLLSDVERDTFLFGAMVSDDMREQLPLHLEAAPPESQAYNPNQQSPWFPGTLEICDSASIRHPRITAPGESINWVMTTDLVLRLRRPPHPIVPISVKYDSRFKRPRSTALLLVESIYWAKRGTPSLLITTAHYDKRVANALRISQPWAMNEEFRPDLTGIDFELLIRRMDGLTVEHALRVLARELQFSRPQAQCAFWQAVWAGFLPINLSKVGWPDSRLSFLPTAEFWGQNPIVALRGGQC